MLQNQKYPIVGEAVRGGEGLSKFICLSKLFDNNLSKHNISNKMTITLQKKTYFITEQLERFFFSSSVVFLLHIIL